MSILELVMIVKNSGNVLRECLLENKKYIDFWTIVDTGSTDDTMNIIRETLSDIPGKLLSIEFEDFSQARNYALDNASGKCKYIIMLDDSYVLNGGNNLRKFLKKNKKDCYAIKIGEFNGSALTHSYYSKRITKTSARLRYKYRVHEDIVTNIEAYVESPDIFIDDLQDKAQIQRTYKRLTNDVLLLEKDCIDHPNDPRVIYYLARTHNALENYVLALKYYKKLEVVGKNSDQYLYTALYESACAKFEKTDDKYQFIRDLETITLKFPKRAEAWYKLAVIYKEEGDLKSADEILSRILYFPRLKTYLTVQETDVIEFFIPYLYTDVKIALKDHISAHVVLQKLLDTYPENQNLINMKMALTGCPTESSTLLSDGKTIVLHTGGGLDSILKLWNPQGDTSISGSEYMAINMAKEFVKRGYRCIIFGPFNNKAVSYEGIYDDIEYIHYEYFTEFCMKYVIDILIISRFVSNIVYYDNVKSVYLWVHDILPIMGSGASCIQYHGEKFKGIIAVSEWQRQMIHKKLNIPLKFIYKSRNAIYPNRFNIKVDKVPFRFIYSSSANRGLIHLIDMIQKIKVKYSQTELYIFTDPDTIDPNLMEEIKLLNYVFLSERIKQDQLAIEFLKSDIWLYPTDFQETYCITAVEAMAAKCLAVTVKLAALEEITKGRAVTCDPPIQDNMDILLNKIYMVLDNPILKESIINKGYNWAIQQNYTSLINEWMSFMKLYW